MNFRSSVAPQDSSRKLLTAFIFILIFVAGAYEFAQLVLSGDMMGFGYVALLVVGSVLGVQYVAKIFHGAPLGVGVESGFDALVVEMGIGGLILWFIMSFAIVVSAWKVVRKLKGTPWFPIAFTIFLYAVVLLLPMTFTSMQAYEDFVINAYFWTLLGILFRLPTLPLSSQFANVSAPAGNPRLRPR